MAGKFQLGQAMATMPVVELCRNGLDLGPFFERHRSGDWGDVSEEQGNTNTASAGGSGDEPIRSSYTAEVQGLQRRIWIVTAGDRTRTVVMLPSDNAG